MYKFANKLFLLSFCRKKNIKSGVHRLRLGRIDLGCNDRGVHRPDTLYSCFPIFSNKGGHPTAPKPHSESTE